MILTQHGINSFRRGGFRYGHMLLDGIVYRTLIYNGVEWTVESLRNDYSTNVVSIDEKYGRLYKYYDAIATVKTKLYGGWRIPEKQDFDNLFSFLGRAHPSDYISTDFGGTNANGFDMSLIGYNKDNSFYNVNVASYVWTDTRKDNQSHYDARFALNDVHSNDAGQSRLDSSTKLSIRLCRNVL